MDEQRDKQDDMIIEQREAVRMMQDYISEHISEEITIEELAGCASFSPGYARKLFEKYLPAGWQEDMSLICQKLDFYTQNIYRGQVYRAADNENGWEKVPLPQGYPRTAIGWEITPGALYWGPKFLWERYRVPFMISENGMSCHDTVMLDGKVHDPNRIDYTHRYLKELRRAGEDGADIRGYFYWSFMDNFEWSYGYTERFGLVYVDYATGERIPKDSLYWYAETVRSNGENL